MAIHKPNQRNQLKVFLWGKEIGTLTWVQDRHLGYFHFSDEYFRQEYDLCPITNPKNEPETHFAIYGESTKSPNPESKIYQGLPPFLADSLPDNWGNAIFDNWFEEKGLHASDKNALTKLSFIGNRAMGAFEFHPMMDKNFYEDKIVNLKELYEESLSIEQQLRDKSISNKKATIESIAALGTSPGGSQKKAIISIAPDGTYHSGKIIPDPSWKNCIIKFNTEEYTLAEIEKTYYDLAIESGLNMTPSELIDIDGTKHFITERFDRVKGEKVVMQTLAAINPEANSYEDLFWTCRKLSLPNKEMDDLFRQTAFNFLMNNTDDHKKNFSFIMSKDYSWHLSPPYDITFIISKTGNTPERTHCMSLMGKYDNVTEEDLLTFAIQNDIRNPKKIIREIRQASLLFEDKAKENGINPYYAEMITNRLKELGRPDKKISVEETTGEISGHTVSKIRFEKSVKGNIHVFATIDGKERRAVVTPRKPLYKEIENKGFNNMPQKEKTKIIRQAFPDLNTFLPHR